MRGRDLDRKARRRRPTSSLSAVRRELAALASRGITITYQLYDAADPAIFVSNSLDEAIREGQLRAALRTSGR